MAESSIPTLKAAFLTRFNEDTDFKNFQVSRGHPFPLPLEGKLVVIGKATSEVVAGSIGGTIREEKYVLEILISVIDQPRVPFVELETEAYRIVALIENSIASWQGDNYQDIFCGWMVPVGTEDWEGVIRHETTGQPQSRECGIKMKIEINANV